MERINEVISKYFSDISKKGHKKNPRPKEFYQMMNKKSLEKRRKKTVDN